MGDGNYPVCLTTVQDLGGVVAEALDYEGRWPVDGGFFGARTTVAELVRLGEKIRGKSNVTQDDGFLSLYLAAPLMRT